MTFLGPLDCRALPPSHWKLLRDLQYQGAEEVFTVPSEFVTDLTSAPWVIGWAIKKHGFHTLPAVLHDWLYANHELVSRRDADRIFRRAMRYDTKTPLWRLVVIYWGVRLFGALSHRTAPARMERAMALRRDGDAGESNP